MRLSPICCFIFFTSPTHRYYTSIIFVCICNEHETFDRVAWVPGVGILIWRTTWSCGLNCTVSAAGTALSALSSILYQLVYAYYILLNTFSLYSLYKSLISSPCGVQLSAMFHPLSVLFCSVHLSCFKSHLCLSPHLFCVLVFTFKLPICHFHLVYTLSSTFIFFFLRTQTELYSC